MKINDSPDYLLQVPNIDVATVEMLKIHTNGDNSIIREIFGAFYVDADQLIVDIKNALASQKKELLQSAAHSLSGVAGSVGALRLKEISTIIENSLKIGDIQTAFMLSEDVGEFYDEFKKDIPNYL